MQSSRRAGRTLFAAVALLLVTLLTAQGAVAQAERQDSRPTAAGEAPAPTTPSASPRSGVQEEDCRPRLAARQTGRVPAAPPPPGRMCDCEQRVGRPASMSDTGTVRGAARTARSLKLPLLHQTLRC
jgi:hypothetical protein